MNSKKWFLWVDFKSMRLPYLLYIVYLAALCFLTGPYIMTIEWYMGKSAPKLDVSIFPYVIIGTALFAMLCVSAVFKETYRENSARYISSLRPTMFQALYKRMTALYLSLALPLAVYLTYAFYRMDSYFVKYVIENPDFMVMENSELYGYPIPESAPCFINIFIQLLIALAAFVLINHAIIALTGDSNVSILVFISYCTAEYFGFSNMIPKWGITTCSVGMNYDISVPITTYSVTHLVLSAVSAVLIVIFTKRRLRI